MKIANAIILAGGRNTRMSALAPKAALPVVNKPNIRRVLEQLFHNKVSSFFITTHYGKIVDLAKEGKEPSARALHFQLEEQPLGTATATKRCVENFGLGSEAFFFVIAADISYPNMNFNLFAQSLERAKSNFPKIVGAVAFLLRPYDEVINRYPIAIINEDNLITSFVERPKSPQEAYRIFRQIKASFVKKISEQVGVPCLPVNSSYYLLARKIFSLVPEPENTSSTKYDFGKLLFKRIPPGLLSAYFIPEKIMSRRPRIKKEWVDMATPSDFWLANWLFVKTAAEKIEGYYDHLRNLRFGQNVQLDSQSSVQDSVIGNNVVIGPGCEIKNCIIGSQVRLFGAKVSRTIVLNNTYFLGPSTAVVEDSIIGGHYPLIVQQLEINPIIRKLVAPLPNGEVLISSLNLKPEEIALAEDSFKKMKFSQRPIEINNERKE